jgi:CRP-like cAMP-binding protein
MPQSPPEQTRSRALSQQLAAALLMRLDRSRYPVQRVGPGKWLRTAEERLDALPYIESGRLDAVLQLGAEGNQVIPVTFVTGEIALLSALFSDEPLYGELVAASDLSLRWIPIRDIEAALLQDNELLVQLVRFLAQRLREVRARERGWLERGVHGRVCAGLARVALETRPEAGRPWFIPATHEHLALRCGVSRPKLSHELKQLENAGVLRLSRGVIEVLNYEALAAAA